MRQEFRLGFDGLGRHFLEGIGDAAMKPLLFIANQGAVGCIPDQRVLEYVG